jgi:hypothetical protein
MPRRIFCSSKLLAEVLEHDNKIAEAKLLEKLWNTSVSFFIDESTYNKHELDFYKEIIDPYKTLKTLNSYDSTQVNYRVNNKALLEEDSIYDYYNDIFIIDEDDNYCDIMIKKYGILIISESTLKNLDSVFKCMSCEVDPKLIYSKSETHLSGWDAALRKSESEFNFKPVAVNSILICDLFALAPKHWDPNPAKNYDIGVENIKSLISYLISCNPNAKVDITLFTNRYKQALKNNKVGGMQFNMNVATKCRDTINAYFPNVNFDIFLHDNTSELHGRYIITNYYRIRDPQHTGIRIFDDEILKEPAGCLEFDGIFKYLNTGAPKGELHDLNNWIEKCTKIKDYVINILKNINIGGGTHQYLAHLESEKSRYNSKMKYNRLFYKTV